VELKPCPFCGGKADLIIVPGYFQQGLSSSGWLVKCLAGCCNQMPYASDHDAIEAWNRRAKDDRQEKVIEGLEQFIADFKPFCGNKADWQRVYDALALLIHTEHCKDTGINPQIQ